MTTVTTTPADATPIAAALRRLSAAVRRPGFGRARTTSTSIMLGRLRCRSEIRGAVIDCDLPAALGGEASAPSPTTLVQAALGACLAIGYRLRAAELGVELARVHVVVESESAVRGMLDPDADVPPGFTALAYRVEIDSAAPEADVQRVVDLADDLSPVLDMLTRPHHLDRTVTIRRLD